MGNIITPELPHDLPENWTDNQYVTPGGTEAGLSEQHGYNYLMKQVNNSQRAISELDAAYGDVSTRVGAPADTGGTATAGTVMGKLNALISSLLSHISTWTAARATNLDASVSSRESEANAAARAATLDAAISSRQSEANAASRYNSLIAAVSGSGKRLVAKKVVTTIPAGTTVTVINVNGGGVLYGGYVSTSQANARITVTIDGTPHLVNNTGNSGTFGRGLQHGQMFALLSSNVDGIPAEFKGSLVVTVEAAGTSAVSFYCDYSLYE